MAIARIEEILSDDYVADLADLAMVELRHRRDECQEAADELSYLRRMAQGRLDIVQSELGRRAGGPGEGNLADVVEQLKRGEIIADGTRTGGFGRLPTTFGPADADGWIARELDAIVDANRLGSLTDLAEGDVRDIADQLTELERRVSEQRGALHDRTNRLQEEIVRRYKSGEETVDSLLS
jgi:hypothetical protein